MLQCSVSQQVITAWAANNCNSCHVAVLGRLFTVVVLRPTQPCISTGSVNEDQLRLETQRQVWFIAFVDKRVGAPTNAGKTVESLDNAHHTWSLLQWGSFTKGRCIKCMTFLWVLRTLYPMQDVGTLVFCLSAELKLCGWPL